MRAVLMYHSLDASGSPISLAPAVFRDHVRLFTSGAVDVLPLETLVEAMGTQGAPPRPQVALTFDDGFANLHTEAFPLLAAHRLPATVFVVSGQVGQDNAWGGVRAPGIPTLPLLDWDALGLAQAQGVTIGAHTVRHPHLSALSAAARADELDQCVADITAQLGVAPRTFAYPYGDVPPSADTLVAARFTVACTTVHRPLRAGERLHAVPRLDAWYFRTPGALDGIGGEAFRLRVLARHTLRSARRLLVRD